MLTRVDYENIKHLLEAFPFASSEDEKTSREIMRPLNATYTGETTEALDLDDFRKYSNDPQYDIGGTLEYQYEGEDEHYTVIFWKKRP